MPPTLTLLPLVTTARLVALTLLWPRMRSEPSGTRLVGEMFVTTLVSFGLILGIIVVAQRLLW